MAYDDYEIDDNDDNDELGLGKEFTDGFKGLISEWDEMYKNMNEEEIKKAIDDENNNNVVTVNSLDDLFFDKEEFDIKGLAKVSEDNVYEIILSHLLENAKSNINGDRVVQCYDYDYAENISLDTGFDKYHHEKFKQYNQIHDNKACYFDDIDNGRRYVFLFDDLKEALKEHGIEMEKINGATDNHSGLFMCTTSVNNLDYLNNWLTSIRTGEDIEKPVDVVYDREETYDESKEYVKSLADNCRDGAFEYLMNIFVKNAGSNTINDKISKGFSYHYGENDRPGNANDKLRVDMFNKYNNTHDNKACFFLDNIKWEKQYFLLDDLRASLEEHGIETYVKKDHGFSDGTITLTTDESNLDNLIDWYNELSGEDYKRRTR